MNTHFQNQTIPTMLNFALLLDAFKSAQKLPQKETNDSTNGIVNRTISYIEKNLGTITSLNELSNHINASLSYLEASFKKSIGLSLMQYIIKSRINLATKKLIETKSSINQVALDCGFNSSTHFSNTFKKHMGFSPRYYRQLYKTTPKLN
jgi:transcriptional regulator GlxA family with amidase domain